MGMRFTFLISVFISVSLWTSAQEIHHNHSIHHAFIENKGQWHDEVLFKSKFDGGNLWVQQKKMVFHLQDFSATHEAHMSFGKKQHAMENRQMVVHLNFLGANEVTEIVKMNATSNYYNYFLGNDERKWASEVRGYGEATLIDFYDGIDLALIEKEGVLKYEFHVDPHRSTDVIRLEYAGQDRIEIDKKGNLIVSTELGKIIEEKPYAYQIVNGNVREVECNFELVDNTVTFKLGSYNPNVEIVIDPVLIFATYSGSVTDNFGMTATYGYDGTAFSGGTIYGNAYPTPDLNAFDVSSNFTVANNPTYGITDVFISKYSPDGSTMLWTTFLGGGDGTAGTETVHSMICDANNNVYVYGATSSTDFPIQGGFQSAHAGGAPNFNFYFNGVYFSNQGTDIFVSKISANGHNLLASTYVGGSGNDGVNYKISSGIYNSVADYDSLTLNYGDQFRGEIILDSAGNCIVASCTRSTDFPVVSPIQNTNAGAQDGVVFKLNNNLSSMIWSTYYGGSDNDACYSVKVDSSENVVFVGGTSSSNLPGMGAGWQTTYNGGKTDGFAVKMPGNASTISVATYIGTANYDQSFFVEIDRENNVYVLGQSAGGNFPVVNTSFVNPGSSQFVVKFDPSLSTVMNSTVFGNGSPGINISPSAFLVDICGNIYISGWGANILQSNPLSGMPVSSNAFQSNPPNGFDFYLLVIERDMLGMLYGSYLGGASAQEHVDGGTSRFDKNGVVYQSVCGGCGGYSDFPTSPGAWSNSNLSTNCNNLIFKFDFELIPNAEFTVDQNIGCLPFTVTFDNFSSQSDSYLWDFGNGDTTSMIFEPVVTFDSVGMYTVYLYVTDSICLLTDTAEITIEVYDSLELSVIPDLELCTPVSTDFIAYTNGTADSFVWSSNPNFSDTLNSNLADSIFTTVPQSSGTYYVLVSNAGCSEMDSVVVDFIGSALMLTANDSICKGESTVVTANNSNPNLTFTYAWSPDSVIVNPSVNTSVEINPSSTQYIYVTATASNGCVVEDSILIHVGDIPAGLVEATASSYLVGAGSEITLFGSPSGYSYFWFPEEGVSNVNAQQTNATIDENTLYTLFVSDGICTRSDTVLVKVFEFVCESPFVYVPNAFTPNGDGENDVLYVRSSIVVEMEFRIYDRWGELVFESYDRSYGWDGTFRGKPMDPDVYDYYLRVTCVDDMESIIKGNITLIR